MIKMSRNILAACASTLLLGLGTAQASVVDLQWVSTLSGFDGGLPGTLGEQITTTLKVDNGGSSTLSQSWSMNDFVSYRVEGASGWFFESTFIELGSGFGGFATDAAGNVTAAGSWYGGYFAGATILTSWAGEQFGGWWNNGNNQIACTTGGDCAWADNVGANLVGSSWTAELTGQVPEPDTIAVLAIGLAALGLSRLRRTDKA